MRDLMTLGGEESELPQVLSYQRMRRMIGYLSFALPVVTTGWYRLKTTGSVRVLGSISEYYYSISRDFFVGTLCMVALFLYAYEGHGLVEKIVYKVAAALSLTISLFSMNPIVGMAVGGGQCLAAVGLPGCDDSFGLLFGERTMLLHATWVGTVHFSCAVAMFVILGGVSFFLFTRTAKHRHPTARFEPTPEKRRRNTIYKVCGVVIWAALGTYGIDMATGGKISAVFPAPLLLTVEWICLWSFGFSWLVKGEGIGALNDQPVAEPAPSLAV